MGKSTEIDYNMMFELLAGLEKEISQSRWEPECLSFIIFNWCHLPNYKVIPPNYHIFNLSMEIENKIKED